MSEFEKKIIELKERIINCENLSELNKISSEIFSKNGIINTEFKKLGSLSTDERKNFAASINSSKKELSELFAKKSNDVSDKEIIERVNKEKIDVTLPEKEFKIGKVHPVSQVIDEISCIFSEIGFSVEEGPDVENEYNNFTALNTPENHPAKDMHDTFYLDQEMKTLLRTHTSPVQVRTMLKGKPPFKIIAPGRTYIRKEKRKLQKLPQKINLLRNSKDKKQFYPLSCQYLMDYLIHLYVKARCAQLPYQQLQTALRSEENNMSDKQIREILTEFDEDKDGTIDFEEFSKMMRSGKL